MATFHRNNRGDILLKVKNMIPESEVEISIISNEKKFIILLVDKRMDQTFQIKSPFFTVENFCLDAIEQIRLQVRDTSNGAFYVEPLLFEPSFFAPHIDFTRSEGLPPFSYATYKRPEKLAVFTHASNEDLFLEIFIKYYSKMIDREHIYIVDHGSAYQPDWLKRETGCQIIRIPKGEVDHVNMKRYVEYFQRFLLTQYEWVLQVDSDELLVHPNGPLYIKDQLLDQHDGCVLQPILGLNLIENPATDVHLNRHVPITFQRRHYAVAEHYNKPILSNIPTTWGLGFHRNLSPQTNVVVQDLYLVHLAHVSIEESARRNNHWNHYNTSNADVETVDQSHRSAEIEKVKAYFLNLLSRGQVEPPAWLHGQF